jgi:Icc-related predicted phosphoesterase
VAPGLWIAGIGMGCGSEGSVATPNDALLATVCARLLKAAVENMKEGDQTILLTHYPARMPEAHREEGFFFDCVWQVCQALQPSVVIQGHAHRSFGKVFERDGMTFFWPGPEGGIVEVKPDGRVVTNKLTRVNDRRRNPKNPSCL